MKEYESIVSKPKAQKSKLKWFIFSGVFVLLLLSISLGISLIQVYQLGKKAVTKTFHSSSRPTVLGKKKSVKVTSCSQIEKQCWQKNKVCRITSVDPDTYACVRECPSWAAVPFCLFFPDFFGYL